MCVLVWREEDYLGREEEGCNAEQKMESCAGGWPPGHAAGPDRADSVQMLGKWGPCSQSLQMLLMAARALSTTICMKRYHWIPTTGYTAIPPSRTLG